MNAKLSAAVIKKIIAADHHDPFSILGMHALDASTSGPLVVRTFQPGARSVSLLPDDDSDHPVALALIDPEGLFEAVLACGGHPFSYRLAICYPDGQACSVRDPYAYPPALSDFDLHLLGEGTNHRLYEKLGAHRMHHGGSDGYTFAVWAPNARRVSLIGDFNLWDGRRHCMRSRGSSGVWEIFMPELPDGTLYKYEIKTRSGAVHLKADPYARFSEKPPRTASVAWPFDRYQWGDEQWLARRDATDQLSRPISIYEVHLGSWKRVAEEGNRSLTYREAAPLLIDYVKEMGYTHIEFLPLAAHPFEPSWGYQVTGYYSPSARYGTPEDLMYLIDQCHQHDIGVILDWVPAHFPKDADALAWFDGTCLYEHADPRQGSQPDWGTLVFNYGRNEVRNFLIANALFWLREYHIDGLRVDAVASMIYLDYSRQEGEWIPNRYGGRENLEAIAFMKSLNEIIYRYLPGVLMIAEESTAWPSVSRPTYLGGLGFAMKWNMGWMHDMLVYMSKEPVFRKFHHNTLTFALLYTFYENFILPFSHDEVVHGKKSMLEKMPGDDWQKFANLRLLLGYMFAHPGKKHLFMGIDIGQRSEWYHGGAVEWHLLEHAPHRGLQAYVKDLNRLYRSEPALFQRDFDHTGFEWIDFSDADSSIITFLRRGREPDDFLIMVFNFTPVPRPGYQIGVPRPGIYREVLNSDAAGYGGSNRGNCGGVQAEPVAWHGRPCRIEIVLPPLGCLIFKPSSAR